MQHYGIEIPINASHASRNDLKSNNIFWRDSVDLEMRNNGDAFEILEEAKQAPSRWYKVTGHLVFDGNMDFICKARWRVDGHKTPDLVGSTYVDVVSRESMRITFTYAALNDLDMFAADAKNSYLQAPLLQKYCFICVQEVSLENVGKVALVYRALYGGKSAGINFRNNLALCMTHLNFVSYAANPDVLMRPAKKSDGSLYYEYILLYTDNHLVISENAEVILRTDLVILS